MVYNIEIRPLATIEILEAYDWYESQQVGLGTEFLDELESVQKTIQLNPLTFSYYHAPVRQALVKRFPYVVVYEVLKTSIVIYSVFMTSQSPGKKRTE